MRRGPRLPASTPGTGSRMPAARSLSHFSSCRTFPCTSATRTGSPPRTSAPSCTRHAPQAASPPTRHAAAAGAIQRCAAPPGDREGQRRRTRTRPAPTGRRRRRGSRSARLASRRPGSSRAAPRGSRRESSVAPVRRPPRPRAPPARLRGPRRPHTRATMTATNAGKQREVGDQQAPRRHRERQADAAEGPQHVGRPVQRAAEVDRRPSPGRARTRGAAARRPARTSATSSGDERDPRDGRMAESRKAAAPAGRRRGRLAGNPGLVSLVFAKQALREHVGLPFVLERPDPDAEHWPACPRARARRRRRRIASPSGCFTIPSASSRRDTAATCTV